MIARIDAADLLEECARLRGDLAHMVLDPVGHLDRLHRRIYSLEQLARALAKENHDLRTALRVGDEARALEDR